MIKRAFVGQRAIENERGIDFLYRVSGEAECCAVDRSSSKRPMIDGKCAIAQAAKENAEIVQLSSGDGKTPGSRADQGTDCRDDRDLA